MSARSPITSQNLGSESSEPIGDIHSIQFSDLFQIFSVPARGSEVAPHVPICLEKNEAKWGAFSICRDGSCGTYHAFIPLEDVWLNWRECLDGLANLRVQTKSVEAAKILDDQFYSQLLYILTRPHVRFYSSTSPQVRLPPHLVIQPDRKIYLSKFDRVYFGNDFGQPYNSMNQSDLSKILIFHSYKLDQWNQIFATDDLSRTTNALYAKLLRNLGVSAIRVILDPIEQGGLATRRPCKISPNRNRTCTFFHSVTSTNRTTSNGGTLNQFLHPLRDFYTVSNRIEPYDPDLAQELRIAISEGLNQLIYGPEAPNEPPNIFKFFPLSRGNGVVSPAWIYYGYTQSTQNAYYLEGASLYKNCGYHVHVMDLLRSILDSPYGKPMLGDFQSPRQSLGNMSVLNYLYKSYKTRKSLGSGSQGFYMNWPSPVEAPGYFGVCNAPMDSAPASNAGLLPAEIEAWYEIHENK